MIKNIGGFQKTSFIDFPKKISSVIFLKGCNLDCWYCHNKSLLSENDIDLNYIIKYIKKRNNTLDGIVVSGGEPTYHSDIISLLTILRELNLPIKLDTNGMLPDVLEIIIKKKLIDYVALDIKTIPTAYYTLGNIKNAAQAILKSIKLIKKIPHEFRTTMAPGLVNFSILKMILTYVGNSDWYLQQFKSIRGTLYTPYTDTCILKFIEILKKQNKCENIYFRK